MNAFEELEIGKKYETQVRVPTTGGTFPGLLTITPEAITLSVTGETSAERKWPHIEERLPELICNSFREQFTLINLVMNRSSGMLLSRHPVQVSCFQVHYTAESIAMSRDNSNRPKRINAIEIHSEAISRWVGHTEKQNEIMLNLSKASKDIPPLNEFITPLKNEDCIGVSYSFRKFYSAPEFSAGATFPPYLHYHSSAGMSLTQAISQIKKIYALYSFITNKGIDIQKIILHSDRKDIYLYLSLPQKPIDNILYPRSTDIRFNQTGLPPFPNACIQTFFDLNDKEQDYFFKFLKYSAMMNPEDSFLGYFRILENLCFLEKPYLSEENVSAICTEIKNSLTSKGVARKDADNFARGVKRLNRSKYNTEKCIQEFYKSLPLETASQWIYTKDKITEICKLRNDITHANNYYIDELSLHQNLAFLEGLLTAALLKVLGVPNEAIHILITRINSYRLVANSLP